MSFLSWMFGNNTHSQTLPTVTTILPQMAKDEIMKGRLPQLNCDSIFLKNGEICHYIDKAILVTEKVEKVQIRNNYGHSAPGLFSGKVRHYGGHSRSYVEERPYNVYTKGILYITNKRVIFQAKENGFEKLYRYFTAVKPYSNGIEIQCNSVTYTLLLAEGSVAYSAIRLIKK